MAATPQVAGVVLAAGAGRRMGGPKALLEVDGQSMVRRATATLGDGGCDPVAVVVGAAAEQVAEQVAATVERSPVAVLVNPRWADGMAGSVRMALQWAGTSACDALVLLPVDTPGISPAVVTRLIASWAPGDARARVATYDGRPRNPVLLPRPVWAAVADRVRGDTGARQWLRAEPDRVVHVDCTDLGDPTDLDTPDDLRRWRNPPDIPAATA